jgi:hypothetical protein
MKSEESGADRQMGRAGAGRGPHAGTVFGLDPACLPGAGEDNETSS